MNKTKIEKTEKIKRTKRDYKKPTLRVIDLAAEEVLAIGCKTTTGGTASLAMPCLPGNSCSGPGS